jgi:hypothetical protein
LRMLQEKNWVYFYFRCIKCINRIWCKSKSIQWHARKPIFKYGLFLGLNLALVHGTGGIYNKLLHLCNVNRSLPFLKIETIKSPFQINLIPFFFFVLSSIVISVHWITTNYLDWWLEILFWVWYSR